MRFEMKGLIHPRLKDLPALLQLQRPAVEDALDSVDVLFRRDEVALFKVEGAVGAPKWAPLSPRYAAWKRRRYPGRKILVLTGTMRSDFTKKSAPGHVAQAYRLPPKPWVIKLGALGAPYYGYHAEGTDKMPAREQIRITPEQLAAYKSAIARRLVPHIMRVVRVMARTGRAA